ncbi:MAG TPA: peptide deformylase [Anaerolineales bacterium]|nr:peptide deformylase [Anaerolineales bacterium]
MALREVITVPNDVLRQKAHKVKNFDKDLSIIIDDMIETLRDAPGVGLAAPQVGILQQIIIVEFGDEDDPEVPAKLYAVVNPKITYASEEKVLGTEGCLSVPGILGDVERSLSIIVQGQNRKGKKVKYKLNGWIARIFQHEINHLEGIIFTDLAERIWQPAPEDYVDNV